MVDVYIPWRACQESACFIIFNTPLLNVTPLFLKFSNMVDQQLKKFISQCWEVVKYCISQDHFSIKWDPNKLFHKNLQISTILQQLNIF